MIVGTALLRIRINEAWSLKEKRGILVSIIKRTQNKFNLAIAQVGDEDLWQGSQVGIAVVSTTVRHAEQQIQNIVNFIESDPRLEIIAWEQEIL